MIANEKEAVDIKGIQDGLLITLGEGEWPYLKDELLIHIENRKSFFKGAKIALDVGNHVLQVVEINSLRDEFFDRDVSLWALISKSESTRQSAKNLGLVTKSPTHETEQKLTPFDTHFSGESSVFVRKTLRSGYKVSHQGHIVILGDVNPGAEIVATGSVIVWGRLRGVVHAGAEGDENSVVCALELNPTQLRIAEYVAIAPGRKKNPQPEIAYIQGGQVIANIWNYIEGGK
ncbi:MAG: septum site-determining protein MinC [Anaerolineaceae bacterium]|jgi:septum site-determining protein MinC|nr:septum site-determining protein MinC [Anaerolineaceae bacterium]